MPKRTASKTRINALYRLCLEILERDVNHLGKLNLYGKLDSGPARDLRDYIKVLAEVKKVNAENLAEIRAKKAARTTKMSEAELTAKVLAKSQ